MMSVSFSLFKVKLKVESWKLLGSNQKWVYRLLIVQNQIKSWNLKRNQAVKEERTSGPEQNRSKGATAAGKKKGEEKEDKERKDQF